MQVVYKGRVWPGLPAMDGCCALAGKQRANKGEVQGWRRAIYVYMRRVTRACGLKLTKA